MNLPELLQQHFNYPVLQKIDPNTQDITGKNPEDEANFGQAAIPALLTGLYKFTRTDEGAGSIIRGDISSNWVQTIFAGHYQEIIERVAAYAHTTKEDTARRLASIASKTVELIREATGPGRQISTVKEFMGNQRNNILPYLPAVLQTGELMDDSTLDDRTNKMEGPVSSIVQTLGSVFSGSDNDEKLEKSIF